MTQWCSGCGSDPIWNGGSHISSLHNIRCLTIFIWCGWAYGTIPSLVHYIFMCWPRPRLGKSAEIQCPWWWWASHNTIMQWLRLYQHKMVSTSHLTIKKGAWQPLYAVDGHFLVGAAALVTHMVFCTQNNILIMFQLVCIWSHQSPGCYLHMCWPTLGKSAEILVYCWASTNDKRVL